MSSSSLLFLSVFFIPRLNTCRWAFIQHRKQYGEKSVIHGKKNTRRHAKQLFTCAGEWLKCVNSMKYNSARVVPVQTTRALHFQRREHLTCITFYHTNPHRQVAELRSGILQMLTLFVVLNYYLFYCVVFGRTFAGASIPDMSMKHLWDLSDCAPWLMLQQCSFGIERSARRLLSNSLRNSLWKHVLPEFFETCSLISLTGKEKQGTQKHQEQSSIVVFWALWDFPGTMMVFTIGSEDVTCALLLDWIFHSSSSYLF